MKFIIPFILLACSLYFPCKGESPSNSHSDACLELIDAIDSAFADSTEYLLVIGGITCSSCVKEILKSDEMKKSETRIGMIVASSAYSHYSPLIRKARSKWLKMDSKVIQACLASDYSLAIFKRSNGTLIRVLEIPNDKVFEAIEFIGHIKHGSTAP